MYGSVQTSKMHEGELIVKEWDQTVSRTEATLKNDTGGTLTFLIGQTLLASTTFKVPAPAGVADSVLVSCGDGNRESITLANNGTALVGIIRGGPIVINQDALKYIASVDATEAAAQRAALDLLLIRQVREPLKQGDVADVLT